MRPIDPKAIDGKFAEIGEHIELLVVGAGPAGLTAAIEGARAGLKVVLADENPIDPALMGMDIPHTFGGRMTAAVQNRARLMEQLVLSDEGFAEAFDAGVDVRLGTTVWGLFAQDTEARARPGLVAGQEDGTRCWLARCDHVIAAAGARDLMLGFAGWDQPGVMGAQALHALLHRYDACSARTLLILGSGATALQTALDAAGRGISVAGIVEPRATIQGPAELAQQVAARSIPVLTGHVIRAADGNADGVQGATVIAVDAELKPRDGGERRISCDTICVAVECVSNVELLAALGCGMVFDPERGGWAPALQGTRTTVARVQAVGDCAGIVPLDMQAARAQGRMAAQAAATGADLAAPHAGFDGAARFWNDASVWMTALTNAGGLDVICCRCESVTRADVLGVRPPPYLNAREGRIAARDLGTLLRDGPPNQDQIKRLTRSGMGECQGRRCREQTAMLIAAGSGLSPGQIPFASYRAPVRPLPLGLLADDTETAAMRAGWDAWFGIPTQWTPWWDIGTERDNIGRDAGLGESSGETWHL